jgi:hypothetical protein
MYIILIHKNQENLAKNWENIQNRNFTWIRKIKQKNWENIYNISSQKSGKLRKKTEKICILLIHKNQENLAKTEKIYNIEISQKSGKFSKKLRKYI